MLEYIADAWERRVNLDRRRTALQEQSAYDERRTQPAGRRSVDVERIIDQAEKRLADAKARLAVLRDYHAYLGAQLPDGPASCDNTLRHTEAYFMSQPRSVGLSQVITLLGLLQANCDCEAYEALHGVLGAN